jgi:tripartite-type tricarboxylate transporter receptor subunit TctC
MLDAICRIDVPLNVITLSAAKARGHRMRKIDARTCLLAFVAVVMAAGSSYAASNDASTFFKDRQVRFVIGADVGTAYDVYARLLAKFLPKHLPGNTLFVPQNMPAGGSIAALNYLYNIADKDGSVIGGINPGAAAAPLFTPEDARYDSRKFNWIGSVSRETDVVAIWHDAPVQNFDELFRKELLVGGSGGAASLTPAIINNLIGTKFKIINGYKSSAEIFLAMERGELQGIADTTLTTLQTLEGKQVADNKIRVIAQYGLSPNANLPGVPVVFDLLKTDEQRETFRLVMYRQELGRAFLLPEGTPQPIVDAYMKAFQDTMDDMDFRAAIEAGKLDFDPQPGAALHELMNIVYAVPDGVIARVKIALGGHS